MSVQALLAQIRHPWIHRVSHDVARGEGVRENFTHQLERFYDLIGQAISTGDSSWIDPVLFDWANSPTQSDLQEGAQNMATLFTKLSILTVEVAREKLSPDEALEVIAAVMPVYTYAIAKSIRFESDARVTYISNELTSVQRTLERLDKSKSNFIAVAAHELKTPLNVMKLKNDVTLIKKREPEKYIEALQLSNKTIQEMNQMISSILEIGRQEGAHFELPQTVDIVDFIRKKGEDFVLLANAENKTVKLDLEPQSLVGCIQTTLLNQILQNFLQNAIKFTPKGKSILLRTRQIDDNKIKLEVIDEGPGIDESIDLFAPFKRVGNAPGAGLGLFLAKSAADAMGAQISLKNRTDGQSGTVATLIFATAPQCELPNHQASLFKS